MSNADEIERLRRQVEALTAENTALKRSQTAQPAAPAPTSATGAGAPAGSTFAFSTGFGGGFGGDGSTGFGGGAGFGASSAFSTGWGGTVFPVPQPAAAPTPPGPVGAGFGGGDDGGGGAGGHGRGFVGGRAFAATLRPNAAAGFAAGSVPQPAAQRTVLSPGGVGFSTGSSRVAGSQPKASSRRRPRARRAGKQAAAVPAPTEPTTASAKPSSGLDAGPAELPPEPAAVPAEAPPGPSAAPSAGPTEPAPDFATGSSRRRAGASSKWGSQATASSRRRSRAKRIGKKANLAPPQASSTTGLAQPKPGPTAAGADDAAKPTPFGGFFTGSNAGANFGANVGASQPPKAPWPSRQPDPVSNPHRDGTAAHSDAAPQMSTTPPPVSPAPDPAPPEAPPPTGPWAAPPPSTDHHFGSTQHEPVPAAPEGPAGLPPRAAPPPSTDHYFGSTQHEQAASPGPIPTPGKNTPPSSSRPRRNKPKGKDKGRRRRSCKPPSGSAAPKTFFDSSFGQPTGAAPVSEDAGVCAEREAFNENLADRWTGCERAEDAATAEKTPNASSQSTPATYGSTDERREPAPAAGDDHKASGSFSAPTLKHSQRQRQPFESDSSASVAPKSAKLRAAAAANARAGTPAEAPKPEATPGGLDMRDKDWRPDAQHHKDVGNGLYKAHDFAAAADAYTKAIGLAIASILTNEELRGLIPRRSVDKLAKEVPVDGFRFAVAAAIAAVKARRARVQSDNGLLRLLRDAGTERAALPNAFTLPELALFLNNRAAAHLMREQVDYALSDVQSAIALDPGPAKFHVRAAKCHVLQLDFAEARRSYTRGVERDPTNAACKTGLDALRKAMQDLATAEAAFEKRKYRSCITALERVEPIAPRSPQLLLLKAKSHLGLKETGQADALTTSILLQGPSSDALLVRGLCCCVKKKDAAAGLRDFQEALRMDPEHTATKDVMKLARAVREAKLAGNEAFAATKTSGAVKYYSTALELDPDDRFGMRAVLLTNRAVAGNKLGNADKAIEDCSAALEADPEYTKARLKRAQLHDQNKDFEEAVDDYTAVLKDYDRQRPKVDVHQRRSVQQALTSAKAQLDRESRKTADHYEVLGVAASANADEIKKAYRKLVLKHHPDRVQGELAKNRAEKQFKLIAEAYKVLSDERARRDFDRSQRPRSARPANAYGYSKYSSYSAYDEYDGACSDEDDVGDYEDIFGQYFSGLCRRCNVRSSARECTSGSCARCCHDPRCMRHNGNW